MKKAKIFVYPLIASAISYLAYIILVIVINSISFKDYGGLGVFFLCVIIWAFLLIPIYCVVYSRLIRDEKHGLIFAFYNPVVLGLTLGVPWLVADEAWLYVGTFFVWATIWTVLPVVVHRISLKYKENEEGPPKPHFLLQNKVKTIVALAFVFVYAASLVFSRDFLGLLVLQNLLYFLPLVTAAFSIIFLLAPSEKYWWHKWVLPIALGANLVYGTYSWFSNFKNVLYFSTNPTLIIPTIISFIVLAPKVLMFFGTLWNVKYKSLLKNGAIGCAVCYTLLMLFNIVTRPTLEATVYIDVTAVILFYMGFFVVATNRDFKP